MDSNQYLRILVLGSRDSGVLDVIKDLTGSAPDPHLDGSIAGLKHEWTVETSYYKVTLPIWVDELSDIEAWKAEFLKPEAAEVVQSIGAWIYCFQQQVEGRISSDTALAMKSIQEVIWKHDGTGAARLAVAVPAGKQSTNGSGPTASQEEQDDACAEHDFEYIHYNATGQNEFGEKRGLERLKEALEANDWEGGGDGFDDRPLDIDEQDILDSVEYDQFLRKDDAELAALGLDLDLASAVGDDGPEQQAAQVDNMSGLLEKLLAVKESSAELPEAERKRMAARAIRDLMKDDTKT